MNRFFCSLLALLLCLSLAACSGKTPPSEQTEAPNPVVSYETAEDASAAAGFSINLPDNVDWADQAVYEVIDGKLLQVRYLGGDRTLTVRKAPGSDDISGNYTDYPEKRLLEVGDLTVDCQGEEGRIHTVVWADNHSTFALLDSQGMTEDEVTALVGRIA